MDSVCVKVCAKINLTLDVVGKRSDGYHNVEMIMQSVNLWDQIILKEIDEGIELDSSMQSLPRGKSNIAWRAAQLIKTKFRISRGVDIFIKKNIPIEAGLAGGSADCAGVLLGLNRLWNLGMDQEKLRFLGKSLGADVPFCLMGGTALAEGIGDMLTPIEPKEDIWLVVVKPSFGVSTREVYSKLKLENIKKRPDNNRIIKYLQSGEMQGIANSLVNVLEDVTIPMHPQLSQIKLELLDQGALGSLMSGSGPSVYGIFKDKSSAYAGSDVLGEKYGQVFALQTTQKGIDFIDGILF